jgi:hypothetical protein
MVNGFTFLYEGYKPEYWYWEIIEIVRRLFFSSVLTIMFTEGSIPQLFAGFFVAILNLYLLQRYQPFERFSESSLSEASQYQIAYCFFVYWNVKEHRFDSFGDHDEITYYAGLSIAVSSVLVVVLAFYYFFTRQIFKRSTAPTLPSITKTTLQRLGAISAVHHDDITSDVTAAQMPMVVSQRVDMIRRAPRNSLARQHMERQVTQHPNKNCFVTYNYIYPSLDLRDNNRQRELNALLTRLQDQDIQTLLQVIHKNIHDKKRGTQLELS